jgi:hypothetical protein
MLRRGAIVKTDVSEELSYPIISVTRIGELGTTLAVIATEARCKVSCYPDDSGDTFLRKVGSYKSHTE